MTTINKFLEMEEFVVEHGRLTMYKCLLSELEGQFGGIQEAVRLAPQAVDLGKQYGIDLEQEYFGILRLYPTNSVHVMYPGAELEVAETMVDLLLATEVGRIAGNGNPFDEQAH